jgi:hypothetical protein
MAGNIDLKAQVQGIGTGGAHGSPVGLAAVDGGITVGPEELGQRGSHHRSFNGVATGRLKTIDIPQGKVEEVIGPVDGLVMVEGPVGDPMAGGIHAGHQAGAGGRADTAGIGLGKFHARGSQQFHIGSPVKIIEGSPFRVKGHGSILPSHVVDQKKEDIGPGKGFGLPCPAASPGGQSGCQHYCPQQPGFQ